MSRYRESFRARVQVYFVDGWPTPSCLILPFELSRVSIKSEEMEGGSGDLFFRDCGWVHSPFYGLLRLSLFHDPMESCGTIKLLRVFVMNLLLSPLWEELIWRGCFFKKLTMFLMPRKATLASSLAWAFWHGGFLVYLYGEGISFKVLIVMPLTYFFSGILLCSTFVIAKESLWPCVLLHSALNAATLVYYANQDRLSEVSSYLAGLVAMAIAAVLMYRLATRRVSVVEPVSAPVS